MHKPHLEADWIVTTWPSCGPSHWPWTLPIARLLEAGQVNELAALWHRPSPRCPIWWPDFKVRTWSSCGGGRVVLPLEGRAWADERGPDPRVGAGRLGPHSRQGERIDSPGDLVAVVLELRRGQENLPQAAKTIAQQLGDAVAALVHTLQQPQTDQRHLQPRLDQVTMLLGQLAHISTDQYAFLGHALGSHARRAKGLHHHLQHNSQLCLLAGNPLMLSLIARVSDHMALPTT